MLDPRLFSTVSLTSTYVLAASPRAGKSLFRPKSVSLLVDSLYAEAIEAVKSLEALSASSPELIWILTVNWVWVLCYDRRSAGQSVLE
jgi:hypothetical protein